MAEIRIWQTKTLILIRCSGTPETLRHKMPETDTPENKAIFPVWVVTVAVPAD